MNEPTPTAAPTSSEEEVARLRARVAELEAQLADQARATNELVARSQEKLYWLERWHVDLDRLMAKPGAQQLLGVVKGVRAGVRLARTAKRKVLG
jgi:uncharacterized coiled-coil protein SlyX